MMVHENVYKVIFMRTPRFTGIKIRKDGDFYLCVSPSRAGIISLNALAGEICLACDGKSTIKDIHNGLTKTYRGVNKEEIAHDLCMCISNLERNGLISVHK